MRSVYNWKGVQKSSGGSFKRFFRYENFLNDPRLQALDDYNQATEERKNQFETLKDKDFESAKVIEMQMKKLAKLQETIGSLKQKFVNNSREFEERNKSLRDEKEALQVHFQDLKKKMNLYRENEHKKLTDLTVLSNQVVRRLKDRVGTAEKLLKLVEMNHKLESEEERMLNTTDNDSSAIITEQVWLALFMDLYKLLGKKRAR